MTEPAQELKSPKSPPRATSVSVWFGRLLPVAGLLIIGAVLFRQQQLREWKERPTPAVAPRALAPRFELADHRRKLVKFERFLGRQRVVLVFFDPQLGVDRDPRLQLILENFAAVDAAGIEVVAISSATPFANLEAQKRYGHEFPFPVLTDIDVRTPIPNPVHRLWGRYDEGRNETLTGVFLIARDGSVPIGVNGFPLPVEDERAVIETICDGEWPR